MAMPADHWLTDHVIRLSQEVSVLSERLDATEEDCSQALRELRRLERSIDRLRAARVGFVREWRMELALGFIVICLGIGLATGTVTLSEVREALLSSREMVQ